MKTLMNVPTNSFNFDFFVDAASLRMQKAATKMMSEMVDTLFYDHVMRIQDGKEDKAGRFYELNQELVETTSKGKIRNLRDKHLMCAVTLCIDMNSKYHSMTGEEFVLRKIKRRDDGVFCPFDAIKFVEEFKNAFNEACSSIKFENVDWANRKKSGSLTQAA